MKLCPNTVSEFYRSLVEMVDYFRGVALRVVMPRKELSFEEVVELIRQKHLNRWRSRTSYLEKQNEQLDENRFLI